MALGPRAVAPLRSMVEIRALYNARRFEAQAQESTDQAGFRPISGLRSKSCIWSPCRGGRAGMSFAMTGWERHSVRLQPLGECGRPARSALGARRIWRADHDEPQVAVRNDACEHFVARENAIGAGEAPIAMTGSPVWMMIGAAPLGTSGRAGGDNLRGGHAVLIRCQVAHMMNCHNVV